jgi:hypothetical protein
LIDVSFLAAELDQLKVYESLPQAKFRELMSIADLDTVALSSSHIIYEFDAGVENFYLAGAGHRLINPMQQYSSVFAVPRYRTLEEAIATYDSTTVRFSACGFLLQLWADSRRYVLVNKPEELMRKSMEQYLRSVLPDADVRPEGIVDESHPVDLRIVWRNATSVALIEIKWVGASENPAKTAVLRYADARARDGAKQLAEYLDANAPRGTAQQTKGYLVVVDARRGRLQYVAGASTSADPLKFASIPLNYSPDYASLRQDFAAPYRMFARPL